MRNRPVQIVVLAILVSGCQGSPSDEPAAKGTKPPALTSYQLKNIGLAYTNYGHVHRGKSPAKAEDLRPYLGGNVWPEESRKSEEECYQALIEGKYGVVWGLRDFDKVPKGTDIVHVYEMQALKTGGFVLFADFRIEWIAAADLEKAIKRSANAEVPPDS
jgi:hypothetical protein